MKGGKPVQMQERKTMLRTVCMLSWPTVLEQALQTGAQYVDTADELGCRHPLRLGSPPLQCG